MVMIYVQVRELLTKSQPLELAFSLQQGARFRCGNSVLVNLHLPVNISQVSITKLPMNPILNSFDGSDSGCGRSPVCGHHSLVHLLINPA